MDYIAQDNPIAAAELDDQFEAAAELACQHPEFHRAGRVVGTREIVVHPHYIMIYQLEHKTLTILRVLHTAQRWP